MKRTKNKEFTHIGKIVEELMNAYRREADADIGKISSIWKEAVGSPIAQNACPAACKGRLLLVHVTSSPWLHQLRFLKPELLHKINAALGHGYVTDIKFKIGSLQA